MHVRQADRHVSLRLVTLAWILTLLSGPAACSVPPTVSPTASPSAGRTSAATATLPILSPSPLPSPAVSDCLTVPGRIAAGTVPTVHLSKPLQFNLYIPPCYDELPDLRYPVLYLFHGLNATADQWIRLAAPATADRLIARREVPAFLIVMPDDPSAKEPNEYGFAEAVTEDLVPYIDSHYRTIPDRRSRAVGGVSRGSGWALHLGLTRPDLFGAIGAHSVVLFGADAQLVDNWLATIPPGLMPRLYLDIGEYDGGLASARILEDMFNAADIPHEWHLNTGSHDEAYWSRQVEEYLRWYAAGW